METGAKRVWRVAGAASTVTWLVSILGSAAITLATVIYGAFAGLPKLAQVFVALGVFVGASFACFAVIAGGVRTWRRITGQRRAEAFPDQIEELIREGLELLREMRQPPEPIKKTEREVHYAMGPDMKLVDKADSYYEKAYALLLEHRPSLVLDFVEAINAKRRELREKWDAKQKEQEGGGDQLQVFFEMQHQEPADYVEAFVHGLRVARKEIG